MTQMSKVVESCSMMLRDSSRKDTGPKLLIKQSVLLRLVSYLDCKFVVNVGVVKMVSWIRSMGYF